MSVSTLRTSLIGKVVVVVATVAVLGVTAFGWRHVTDLENEVTKVDVKLGNGKDGAVDILLVGIDSRTDAQGNPLSAEQLAKLHAGPDVSTSTDTILLVRIPNNGSSATAISIPRDTYVQAAGPAAAQGKEKINAVYGSTRELLREKLVNEGVDPTDAEKQGVQAGREALIDTVANLTGVEVDRYAEVGLLGFVNLTDAIGGVEICVKRATSDVNSGANFKAGRYKINGAQALSYVRQRHNLPRGDLDRIVRQQAFLASMTNEILSAGTLTNPSKLNALEKVVINWVALSDGWNVIDMLQQLRNLTGDKVAFSTIPVVNESGWSDDGMQSVVIVDPAQVQQWTAKLLEGSQNATKKRTSTRSTVDVVNASSVDGLAGNVKSILTRKGFKTGTTSNGDAATMTQSKIVAPTASNTASNLRKALKLPITFDKSVRSGHVQVILADDYSGPGSLSDNSPVPAATDSENTTSNDTPPLTADKKGPACVY